MSENQFCKFRVESLKSYSLPAIGYRLVDGSPFYSLRVIASNVWRVCEVPNEVRNLGERVQRSEPYIRLLGDPNGAIAE